MRISDWSSDVCSSDLDRPVHRPKRIQPFDDEAAAKKGQARAEIWAGHEQADRPRAFLAVEIVADDRNRSRTDDGFADPETQAQHEQKDDGGGETAERKSTRLKSSHSCGSRMPASACKKKKT